MELIVFDLDGTLLNADSQISNYTRETLVRLAKKNIAYTVATGRTLHSAQEVLRGHGFRLPHIYSNGVLIWDPRVQALSLENVLTVNEARHVLKAAFKQGVTPFVSTVDRDHCHRIYHSPVQKVSERSLLKIFQSRENLQLLPLEDLPTHAAITNISVLGAARDIDAIEDNIHNEPYLVAYSGPAMEGQNLKWMDIHHSNASKGGAICLLKKQLGISRLLCFGDSDNDLSMFAMADESYAPDNAKTHVKAAATDVIGHHHQDGIARYLRERFDL